MVAQSCPELSQLATVLHTLTTCMHKTEALSSLDKADVKSQA